jgi:two-component system, NtrC family, sensor kinase
MLKTKLFQAFAVLVLVFGLLSAFIGLRIIKDRVVGEAQEQVRLDLGSAWATYNFKLHDIETILDLIAIKKAVVDAAADRTWDTADIRQRLEVIQTSFKLDFLSIVSPEGQVVFRAAAPHNIGDFRSQDTAIAKALKGQPVFGTVVMSRDELQKEGDGLVEHAYLALDETPHARLTPRKEEDRGMALFGAVPIMKGPQLIGVIYAGVLLNRNHDLVDQVADIVFKNERYKGAPMGTATIFLNDCRIATTVRLANGNRAIGTRASKEVADRVLDNGNPWVGPALVVNDPYLTAYDPIRDVEGKIIGMLYVGRLERPYRDLGHNIMFRYAGLLIFGLAAALLIAFIMASRLAQPIHALVQAAGKLHRGEPQPPIQSRSSCREIEKLVVTFNDMAKVLEERESKLKALNKSYMEMLGFVSHELKSPVSAIMNYIFLLRQHKLGALTEPQEKAVKNIETSSSRIVEMVRHYLNLSRIENGELRPIPTRVAVLEDVVTPLLETFESDIAAHRMRVENRIDAGSILRTDLNMTREVFENLFSNAIKYGREDAPIVLGARTVDGFVEFSIRNEGPGIPADKIDAVFQKFTRLEDQQYIRRQKGTGLGLFITRHIIEAHGGKITVESRPQEWVEFRFTLPRFEEKK